jgi:bifunctional non-homologous end joining protein LigD
LVAHIEEGGVALYSRSGLIVSGNYKPIAEALEKVRHDAVIDGELVALDEHGISRFQLLQNALNTSANLRYGAFDIMFLDGEDLRDLPLVERKKRLKRVLPKQPLLIYSDHWPEHGKRVFHEAEKLGLEGIMAKRARSRYLSGARSRDWLKIKTGKRQEAVIVGFTAPRRSRECFGALVLAVRDKGGWRYVGRVGTGFSHAMLKDLHGKLWPLRTASSPFRQRVKEEGTTTWVKPRLVAEVKFTEWTGDGEMRHPAFLGLRQDKKPMDAVLEKEQRRPV